MSSIFEQAAALTSAAVDTIYGEIFTFIGMKPGADRNLPKVIDMTRPAFSVTAAQFDPSKSAFPRARGMSSNQAQRHVVTEPFVSVDNGKLQWPVVTGDRVLRLKTNEQFEVARPEPDGVTRTLFFLTAKTTA